MDGWPRSQTDHRLTVREALFSTCPSAAKSGASAARGTMPKVREGAHMLTEQLIQQSTCVDLLQKSRLFSSCMVSPNGRCSDAAIFQAQGPCHRDCRQTGAVPSHVCQRNQERLYTHNKVCTHADAAFRIVHPTRNPINVDNSADVNAPQYVQQRRL